MAEQRLVVFGPFRLDVADERLWSGEDVVRLTPKAFAVLCCLIEQAGQLVTKDALLESVWPETIISEATLTGCLRELRRALGDSARSPQFIETVHRRGYRFIAALDELPHDQAASSAPTDIPVETSSRFCPVCQHTNPLEAFFCNACAAPLDSNTSHATAAEPRASPASSHEDDVSAAKVAPSLEGERRQLTVMVCALVASTSLAERLDPEELREVVHDYQATCADVIDSFEGYIAQYLADGLLVYFGYPQAHEDDAQRAVRAGLGMLSAMNPLNTRLAQTHGVQLAIRVGIHTGLVVIGDMGHRGRQKPLALGITPALAARLQELAAPNTVMMSAATHQLVQGYVVCDALGTHHLQGLHEPIEVYQAQRLREVQNRFAVVRRRGLTPLVGRARELGLLQKHWSQARGSTGRVVLLSGEAGIGKSRLVQALKDEVCTDDHMLLECQSSLYYQHTAFWPLTKLLPRLCQWQVAESAESKLAKLEELVARIQLPTQDAVPLLAQLLMLPVPVPLDLTPRRQRQKTFDTLLSLVVRLTVQQPVLFIVEDMQWVDPSTLAFLELLVEQVPMAALLTVVTSRPTEPPLWVMRSHVTHVSLDRLAPESVAELIRGVAGGDLPKAVCQQIMAVTDGVPLFVEEVTKMVLQARMESEAGETWPEAIPTTLQDLLRARLDQVGASKEVAQLGATVGRSFDYALLHALSSLEETELQQRLQRLVSAELLNQLGIPPQSRYIFKHALIQGAAYQSLLRRTRQTYHERVAQILETQFPEIEQTQPELLAHHYTEAGRSEQAWPYWQRAGQLAAKRSAYVEAVGHLNKGLDVLKRLPDTLERRQYELDLLALLGPALTTHKGFSAPEVGQVYARARELVQQVDETPRVFSILRGMWRFYQAGGDMRRAQELAEHCLNLAQRAQASADLVEAYQVMGITLYHVGELTTACTHLKSGIDLYDASQHHSLAYLYGEDPGVACLARFSHILWMLGYPDQALKRSQESLTLAQKLSHPFSLAYALGFAAMFHQHRREGHATHERAESGWALGTEHDFVIWVMLGTFLGGWAMVFQGRETEGMAQMHRGLAIYRATESKVYLPVYLAVLAEAYGEMGQPEAGLEALDEALGLAATTGVQYYVPECYRLRGDLLLAHTVANQAEAETCFRQALEMARHQEAKSLELRAAISLARLWQQQDKQADARQLLAESYGWFSEGFDTVDLRDAKTLLEELGA